MLKLQAPGSHEGILNAKNMSLLEETEALYVIFFK